MAEPLISVDSSTTTDPIALPQSDDDNKNKLVVFDCNNNNNNDHGGIVATKKTKKKSVNILKVALMLILRRPAKPNVAAVDVASKSMWKRLFASMRPLHLQSNESPEQEVVVSPSLPPMEVVDSGLRASPSMENFEDVVSLPLSPNYVPKSSSVSSIDEMSRMKENHLVSQISDFSQKPRSPPMVMTSGPTSGECISSPMRRLRCWLIAGVFRFFSLNRTSTIQVPSKRLKTLVEDSNTVFKL